MAHRFVHRRRVEFSETDLAGIMHFSNFFRFMESAEHAFYRSLGFSVHPFRNPEGEQIGWPRLHASADYRMPLAFEEVVDIELLIDEIREKTIRYRFHFWKNPDDAEQRAKAAQGWLVVVAVAREPVTGRMSSVPIPNDIRALIEEAPKDEESSAEGATAGVSGSAGTGSGTGSGSTDNDKLDSDAMIVEGDSTTAPS